LSDDSLSDGGGFDGFDFDLIEKFARYGDRSFSDTSSSDGSSSDTDVSV